MQLHVIISLLSPKSTLKGHGPRKLMNNESLPRSEVFNRDYFRSVFVKGASSSPLSKKKKFFSLLHFLKSSYAVLFLQLHPQKEDMSLWSLHANYSIQHLTPIFCFKLEWEVYLQPNNWCYALFSFSSCSSEVSL